LPGISTHVNFAQLIFPELAVTYDSYHFLLGTIAPDSFNRDDPDSFHRYHFTRGHAESDLHRFQTTTHQTRQHGSPLQLSFIDGYYAHLWLDNFVRTHQDELFIRNPAELTGDELREAVRANIEQYSLAAIGGFLEGMKVPASEMTVVPSLEFVSTERAREMLQRVKGASQGLERTLVAEVGVDEEEYGRFLSEAAERFVAMWEDVY
jgi:hypothetical protein